MFYDRHTYQRCSQLKCTLVSIFPLDLMEVTSWLLHPNPKHRATISDMERDPWVLQDVNINDYVWEEVLPNSGRSTHCSYSLLYIPWHHWFYLGWWNSRRRVYRGIWIYNVIISLNDFLNKLHFQQWDIQRCHFSYFRRNSYLFAAISVLNYVNFL